MIDKLPKAAIFDWDNTLVNSLPLVCDAINATLSYFGLKADMTVKKVQAQSQHSAKDLFPRIFGSNSEQAQKFYYEKYEELSRNKIIPLPGALALLKLFADQKIYMAIVSNKRGSKLREEVETLGFTHYFKEVVGSTDCAYDKPSPLCVDRALQQFVADVDRKSVWFIGDTMADYLSAIDSECVPILVADVDGVPVSCAKFDGCQALEDFCTKLVVQNKK